MIKGIFNFKYLSNCIFWLSLFAYITNAKYMFLILAPIVITNAILISIIQIYNGNNTNVAIFNTITNNNIKISKKTKEIISGFGITILLYNILQICLILWLYQIYYINKTKNIIPILGDISTTTEFINPLHNFFYGLIIPFIYIAFGNTGDIYGIHNKYIMILFTFIYIFILLFINTIMY